MMLHSAAARRRFLAGALGLLALAACNNGAGGNGAATIDARVDSTLSFMVEEYPATQDILDRAAGVLVMPLVTEVGLGLGAAYGTGALRIGGATVDYYAATAASAGLQIGAQQYSHVLFFMSDEALADFRASPGWVAGAGVEYVANTEAETFLADTVTALTPVIAVVFGQTGLRLGATIEGTKYTRIIP